MRGRAVLVIGGGDDTPGRGPEGDRTGRTLGSGALFVGPEAPPGAGVVARGRGPELSRFAASAGRESGGGFSPVLVTFFARICSSRGMDVVAGGAGAVGGGGVPRSVVWVRRSGGTLGASALLGGASALLPGARSGRGVGRRPEGGGGGILGVEGSLFDTRPGDDTATGCPRDMPKAQGLRAKVQPVVQAP